MRRTYKSYKHSGVEWIGEIPSHWAVKPLKRVSRYNTEVLSEATAADEMISYIEISDVDSQSGIRNSTEYTFKEAPSRARRLVKAGDTLVSTVRTYLKAVGVVQQEQNGFIASTGFCVLRPVDLESGFQGYVCKSRFIEEVARRSVGVSYPAINSTDLVEIPVPQPPYDEQQTISTYLDEKTALIDSAIRKKEKLIELLQEERTAIINQAVTRGLDPNVRMKDSGVEWLGEIPEHWDVLPLKRIANPILGKMLTPDHKPGFVKLPYLRAQNIRWLKPDLSDVKEMWFSPEEATKLTIQTDDLLVSEGGEVGRTCIWSNELTRVCIQNSVHIVRVFEPHFSKFYLYHFYITGLIGHFDAVVNRISIAHLTGEKLRDIKFVVPPPKEQELIVRHIETCVGRIESTISKLDEEIQLLHEYRTALINEVVTGKRCVI